MCTGNTDEHCHLQSEYKINQNTGKHFGELYCHPVLRDEATESSMLLPSKSLLSISNCRVPSCLTQYNHERENCEAVTLPICLGTETTEMIENSVVL